MILNETNIEMTRGDTEAITVMCVDNSGVLLPFVAGDTVYFTVKENVNSVAKLFQIIVTEFIEGKASILINPEHTKLAKFRDYVYDVQVSRADGTVNTIIRPSKFSMKPEVTYE